MIRIREGEELKAPRHASAAATRDGNLPSRDGSLPHLTATCLIPDKYRPKESRSYSKLVRTRERYIVKVVFRVL